MSTFPPDPPRGESARAESDCDDVLRRMYHFIDNELDRADYATIQAHLEECGPCLHEIDIERMVKSIVARSCHEHAPEALRQRVMFSIRQVQVEIRSRHDQSGQ